MLNIELLKVPLYLSITICSFTQTWHRNFSWEWRRERFITYPRWSHHGDSSCDGRPAYWCGEGQDAGAGRRGRSTLHWMYAGLHQDSHRGRGQGTLERYQTSLLLPTKFSCYLWQLTIYDLMSVASCEKLLCHFIIVTFYERFSCNVMSLTSCENISCNPMSVTNLMESFKG